MAVNSIPVVTVKPFPDRICEDLVGPFVGMGIVSVDGQCRGIVIRQGRQKVDDLDVDSPQKLSNFAMYRRRHIFLAAGANEREQCDAKFHTVLAAETGDVTQVAGMGPPNVGIVKTVGEPVMIISDGGRTGYTNPSIEMIEQT